MEVGDIVLLNVANGKLCFDGQVATHRVRCKIVALIKGSNYYDSIFIVPLTGNKLNADSFDTLFDKNRHLNLLEKGALDKDTYVKHMYDICLYLHSCDTAHFSLINNSDVKCRK